MFRGKNFASLTNTYIPFDSLLSIWFMWYLNVNFSSKVTPSIFADCALCKVIPAEEILKFSPINLLLKIIYDVLSIFSDSLLECIQFRILDKVLSDLMAKLLVFLSLTSIEISSAKETERNCDS